jgi:hypothetical protein
MRRLQPTAVWRWRDKDIFGFWLPFLGFRNISPSPSLAHRLKRAGHAVQGAYPTLTMAWLGYSIGLSFLWDERPKLKDDWPEEW